MAVSEPDCLFCKIAAGKVPADIVREGERTLAFRDINPQAPVHVLIIPRDHYPTAAAAGAAGEGLLDEIAREAHEIAEAGGVAEGGYRLVFNTGADAGQTVFHLHGHVLGGRGLEWPPG
ncbi:histidine triad (HIT) family protein [Spinactinospora alkalitolerans]|uniref:Histidine triad (HIT) family protein n=1 Tax=Spinactinospora alkalitolerans TaxID=687207 RepID=A0A852U289_9ACTN|nr:histidine triad nucleotide-binding protein [Spinactinospora alkalitolerans]NYE49073.1 histidine triad (HIT) family protein [Spinactinospora alkalitolerans]